MTSAIRTNLECKDCGSSDALAEYEDHTYCFSCGKHTKTERIGDSKPMKETQNKDIRPLSPTFHGDRDRGIMKSTAEKYKAYFNKDTDDPWGHYYPYTRRGGHVANKRRARHEKQFTFEGSTTDLELFGQSVFPAGSAKTVTLVEGEIDAMSAYQMSGDYPVVSIINGADSAVRDVKKNYEYLNSFENIVICFDKDEAKIMPDGKTRYPGQEAAQAVAEMFPIGKVRVLTLASFKDPNEYLLAGKMKEFTKEWWKAPVHTPEGLKGGSEIWDEVINPPAYETIDYPYPSFNDKTYGIRLSELVIINAPPKVGKSTVLGEISHSILMNNPDTKLGLMRLEESNRDTALNLMSIHASKRLNLPDVWEDCTPEEIETYFNETVGMKDEAGEDRVIIWDHFGSNSVDVVLDKMRHMHALGCKYIILDHISILVSDQSGDERKQLDELATKIKSLTMELNICVMAVVHQNRAGEIRGTQGIEQLANIIFKLDRDKVHEREEMRNVVHVTVTENRFCGDTGPTSKMYFNPKTGRLSEITEEEFKNLEQGELPW